MSALPQSEKMTEAEYLAFEFESETKHEFFNGEIFAMAGASNEHLLITGSTYAALYNQTVDRPYVVYQTDMRLKVLATGLYTYPDIIVVCGEPKFTEDKPTVLTNPNVIIEVLSPSTEAYDRGKKFRHYSMIPSLQEIVFISQDVPRIERFLKQGIGKWELLDVRGLDESITLTSIDCTLKLADVYRKIEFTDEEMKD
jgi:Uma2 family endonuclease